MFDEFDTYIGREVDNTSFVRSLWANNFSKHYFEKIGGIHSTALVIERYRESLARRLLIRKVRYSDFEKEIINKRIGCWCISDSKDTSRKYCHGMILRDFEAIAKNLDGKFTKFSQLKSWIRHSSNLVYVVKSGDEEIDKIYTLEDLKPASEYPENSVVYAVRKKLDGTKYKAPIVESQSVRTLLGNDSYWVDHSEYTALLQ